MKPLDILKAPFSLGLMAVVMLAMAAVLLTASAIMYYTPAFDDTINRMELLDELEGTIADQLVQIQLNEAYAIFTLEYELPEEEDYAQMAVELDAELSKLLDELDQEGYFSDQFYDGEEILLALNEFNSLRDQHRQTFEQVLTSYDVGNSEETLALIDILQNENEQLSQSLDSLILLVEFSRQESQAEFPTEANQRILIIVIGLTFTLLLGLIAYQRIWVATEPLNALTNAIMAIGGGQYRSVLLAGLLKKSGPAGASARELDALANGIAARNAGLIQEIERQRQALYESRRRRLKITRPVEERSKAQ